MNSSSYDAAALLHGCDSSMPDSPARDEFEALPKSKTSEAFSTQEHCRCAFTLGTLCAIAIARVRTASAVAYWELPTISSGQCFIADRMGFRATCPRLQIPRRQAESWT